MSNIMSLLNKWLSFLVLSGSIILITIALGVDYTLVLNIFAYSVGFLTFVTIIAGFFFKEGFYARSLDSQRRLDGHWAIVTGANRFVLYIFSHSICVICIQIKTLCCKAKTNKSKNKKQQQKKI